MSPATKLAAFVAVLGVALGGGAAVGNAVGPLDQDTANTEDTGEHEEHGSSGGSSPAESATEQTEDEMPAGVLVSQNGYTIDADSTTLDGAPGAPFAFRITGPDGVAVEEFMESHERELHLIVVGTDLGTYAHLHPSRDRDGTWSVSLPALVPGVYRAFADFAVVDGPELTLGVDLTVAGDARFAPLPATSTTTRVDGYDVELTGSPVTGSEAELTVSVSRDGEPVTDLEPYLGAFGHLVAIRAGDLAYLHVHPLGDEPGHGATGGPDVRFAVDVPSAGDYRLFFDFSHGGSVHTAAFTVQVPHADGQA